ncbi:MAG: hypothetical protein HPY52_07250 [Firmicutes bacterium]|nr:hypothetical protein [Bacillota bacterium]
MEYSNIKELSEDFIRRTIEDTQSLQRRETEDYLRELCIAGYPERQRSLWLRDYTSLERFLTSVEPNRKRWQEALGEFRPEGDFEVKDEPFLEDDKVIARWVSIRFSGSLRCRAVLALPKGGKAPFPLVISQHGILSSPENVFGFLETAYHGFGYRLARDGYAVLAPLNISGIKPRARYTRMALLLGKTLFGLEVSKLRRLIDYVSNLPEVDQQRIGMWGISLGGAYTLLTLPLEARIKVGIICAFFNHRLTKMIIDDPRYSCFLSTEEEHAFIPGWLREFSDSDLVSLICPRPLLIQTGKADGVSWWPFVLEEFKEAKGHYERLGLSERILIDLHEGGHEIRYDTGLAFLRKWL